MQQLQPVCKCGQAIEIPEGHTKAKCPTDGCGLDWERDESGYWASGTLTLLLTPVFTEDVEIKLKLNKYQKMMKWRDSSSKIPKTQHGSKRTGLRH